MNSYMAVTTIVIFPISWMKQKNNQRTKQFRICKFVQNKF